MKKKQAQVKSGEMTVEIATKEFCTSMGFYYKYVLKRVRECDIDIKDFLMRLDRETNVIKRIDIGQELIEKITPNYK